VPMRWDTVSTRRTPGDITGSAGRAGAPTAPRRPLDTG
jgi:hypothetical protein